ncbi:hypothetical protein SynA1840_01172 [Synechococcus sp. A18-40]|nr:hypothetical protein SynA1840_01172 [Synechococcus sp. A18-40]
MAALWFCQAPWLPEMRSGLSPGGCAPCGDGSADRAGDGDAGGSVRSALRSA